MSIENGEGSSIGLPGSSDEDNGMGMTGGASSIGTCSGTGALEDSDLSDDDDIDLPSVDRYGFTGGKQFTDDDIGIPIKILRKREMKWLDMIDDWEKWMAKKPKKVRERCRKGIPSSLRGRAWQYMCGSKKLIEDNKSRFEEIDMMEGDPKWLDVIEKDLDRQFPFHEMFAKKGGNGQQDLYRILKAYSIYNPRDGYCQGQAPVAAVLLMHMPAEEAFWTMVQICERYLTGYYSPGLEAVQVDGEVLFGLVKKILPQTYKHLKKFRIEPILYMTEWFMCIFARTLPWTSVLRVLDMFIFEGVKVLFRVAIVLLKFSIGTPQQLAESQGLYETMEKLKHIPDPVVQEDFLVNEMLKTRVFEKDLEAEHALSLARRKAIRQRQMASESAAAMARDIEVKKKITKVNPAKQWEKDKKRKEKERLKQNDTDSVLSVPNSVDSTDRYDSDVARMDAVANGMFHEDKDKKKKDKKQKKKGKLFIEAAAASQRTYSDDLQSPDIENEFEIVDKISMSSASPTKSMRGKYTTSSDKDNTSEDMLDVHSSKKKKKDKKKKSKGKEKESADGFDDTESVSTMQGSVIDDRGNGKKESKKDKKKKGKKEKSLSVEEFDDSSSIMTVQSIDSQGKKKDKKKDKKKKKGKDSDMGDSLPGMVRDDSVDINLDDDAVSIQSMSKKDKKKDKKAKKKALEKELENAKGNGSIPNESASDGNISSPANLSDFEVVERFRPPSEASKRGSDKRKGQVYCEDDLHNQWKGMADFGPIPEIPSYDEIRERRLSRERAEEEERRKRLSPQSEPTTPSGGSGTKQAWAGAKIQHSYSNGMDPNAGIAQMRNNAITDANTNVTKTHVNPMREYQSFDYGTTV